MTEFKFLGELPIPLRHTYAILNIFNMNCNIWWPKQFINI